MIDKEALWKKYEAMKPPDLSPRASGAIWNVPQVTTITLSYCACGMSKWGDAETCERCIILDLLSECSRLASRVEELEKLIAKHSGSLNSADSASNGESTSAAKETRE